MTYRIDNIRKILDDPSPCDNCKYKQSCKDNEMACRVFSSYVVSGEFKPELPRIPNCFLYNKIFKETDEKALKEYLRSFKDGQEDLFDLVADKTLK